MYRDNRLGFTIDWGGIINNTVKAYGAVTQAKSAIILQRAQQEAALRAQEAEFQRMQRQQAMMVAQPADSGRQVIQIASGPAGGRPHPQTYQQAPGMMAGMPPWAIPAAIGVVGLLFLMRK